MVLTLLYLYSFLPSERGLLLNLKNCFRKLQQKKPESNKITESKTATKLQKAKPLMNKAGFV